MKKLVLSVAITLGGLSVQPVMAATPKFSSSAMAQNTIADLKLENIVAQFYKGEAYSTTINDKNIKTMPYMSLGSTDGNYKEQTIAVMHPVVTYTNTSGEPRYLAAIEQVRMTSKDHKLVQCHVCAGKADLFIFKKLKNGSYQLVSKTPEDVEFAGSWGRVQLDLDDLKKSIQPLGKNLIGGFINSGYMSSGIIESQWQALHLAEDDDINVYFVGDAGSTNSGYYDADSPKAYDYKVSYKVKPNNAKYYPIQLTYKGTKENHKAGRVEKVNYSETVRFNPKKASYE